MTFWQRDFPFNVLQFWNGHGESIRKYLNRLYCTIFRLLKSTLTLLQPRFFNLQNITILEAVCVIHWWLACHSWHMDVQTFFQFFNSFWMAWEGKWTKPFENLTANLWLFMKILFVCYILAAAVLVPKRLPLPTHYHHPRYFTIFVCKTIQICIYYKWITYF